MANRLLSAIMLALLVLFAAVPAQGMRMTHKLRSGKQGHLQNVEDDTPTESLDGHASDETTDDSTAS